MAYRIIILLFIGFNRIWHFVYIRIDPMLCSIFNVVKLPYVTTYWRYVDSLGINQGKSLLDVMSALRERVAALRDKLQKHTHQYGYDGRDYLRETARRAEGAQYQESR